MKVEKPISISISVKLLKEDDAKPSRKCAFVEGALAENTDMNPYARIRFSLV